jgi:hypothetical protein
MTFYSLVLFVHVAAVLALFAALSFEALSLSRLRRASSLSELALWMDPVPKLPLMVGSSALFILLSGIYLTKQTAAFDQWWPIVATAAFFLTLPLGAMTGRRMSEIRRAYTSATAMNSELRRQMQNPFLKISLLVRLAIFLGIVLLMTAKPDLWQSISIVGSSIILGLLMSFSIWRSSASSASGVKLGN